MAKFKCLVCGKNADSPYCMRCKPKKPLSRGRLKQKPPSNLQERIDETEKQKDFFHSIWMARPHRSEISNVYLGEEPFTYYFHHILPKSKYPQLRYSEDNIILLSWEEHQSVEQQPFLFEIVNKRRQQLKEKYENKD